MDAHWQPASCLASVRKYGLCGTASRNSVCRVQLHEALECEKARYLHRTVPPAVIGGLIVVGLIVAVFRAVVPPVYLYIWFAAFALMTTVRMISWSRYRKTAFDSVTAARWLREATGFAFVSGVAWGLGSLFLFPEGQLLYQYTFLFALVMMSMAGMFSYAPHYPAFLAFCLPSLPPGILALAIQGTPQQVGFAVGVLVMCGIILWAVRSYNHTFVESIRLRFENLELVAQLTVQKDSAVSANLAKSRFLAAASHDLRQPMHALNLYLGAFAQLSLANPAVSLLAKVRQCAQIMDEMFRALLDISKLDAGAVQPQVIPFPLAPLLARTRLEFEPQARAKGLELRIVSSSTFVNSDPALVERILRNLVSNAIRYTEAGRVIVGCRRRKDRVRISVYDTGLGIELREQALVFEEFYQVGNRERDRTKGMGLGLAIVERLAKLLGSPITLRSQPGRGSLFAFDLPATQHAEMPVARAPHQRAVARSLAGTLIVLVDDEELILDAARTLLQQWDCTVIAAPSGLVALQQLASSSRTPDVLICDYRLRDEETGVNVVEAVRNEFNTDIPALLITGDTDPEQLRKIAASGLAVLHKPLREDELSEALWALRAAQPALAP
jgi:two-component system, sensor histidine kinase